MGGPRISVLAREGAQKRLVQYRHHLTGFCGTPVPVGQRVLLTVKWQCDTMTAGQRRSYGMIESTHWSCVCTPIVFVAVMGCTRSAGRLPIVATGGAVHELKRLLDRGVDPDATGKCGRTPLHYAAYGGHADVVRALVGRGASVNARASDTDTEAYVLHNLVRRERFNRNGRRSRRPECLSDGTTPLHLSALKGHAGATESLMASGANVNVRTNDGYAPLHYAAYCGHTAAMQVLLNHGAAVDLRSEIGETPLHLAAWEGHTDAAALLLSKAANVEASNRHSCKPLYGAAQYGHLAVVELLLASGAQCDLKNIHDYTALHAAAYCGHRAVADVLLVHGADTEARSTNGSTPLHLAAAKGHATIVGLLLGKGAHVAVTDKSGRTPLHKATRWRRRDVIRLLLASGARVNATCKDGQSGRH